tara:strand:- start:752 stop:937 length:186 start_codon:yes stop_codon:yes gene_type:complete
MNFKVGDRVEMSPMWKHNVASGRVIKITKDYVVVDWEGIPGEWHYTHDQSVRLRVVIDENS